MSNRPFTVEKARISAATLYLAAGYGWEKVTLDEVAQRAKIVPAKLKARFALPLDLIPVIAEQIDREAFAGINRLTGTPHDRLFDLLMARFDVLQRNRKAISNLADAARHDRKLTCVLSRATLDGAYRLIDTARLNSQSPPRLLVATGLVATYTWAFCVWCKDNSRDMAKTMAVVDRGLRISAKAAELIKRPP